jgi:hypothetical protein
MTFFSYDFADGFADGFAEVISYKDIVKWLEQEDTESNNACEQQFLDDQKKEAFERVDQDYFDQVIAELGKEEKVIDEQLYVYLSQYKFVIDLCDSVLE